MNKNHLNHPSFQRSWVEVNLTAIKNNLRSFGELMGSTAKVMPAVKADAYGHGAIAISRAALDVGCERLAVATVLEGEELRVAGINADIQILGSSLPDEIPVALHYDMTLGIHEIPAIKFINEEAKKQQKKAKVHLKVDTGMGRLGILPENILFAARNVDAASNLELEGLYMHLADASDESYSQSQLQRFRKAAEVLADVGIEVLLKHASSSTGAILFPDSRFDLIRPGAGVYGYHSPTWIGEFMPLEPALSWHSVVVQVKDYPPGLSLGYNRTFTTRRPTRIAVIPIGYGDGYLRSFSNHTDVLINGRRAPVVGMISMDYSMADVTGMDNISTGTDVTLIGRDGDEIITVEELADKGGTIPYIITTCLGRRPGRCYTITE